MAIRKFLNTDDVGSQTPDGTYYSNVFLDYHSFPSQYSGFLTKFKVWCNGTTSTGRGGAWNTSTRALIAGFGPVSLVNGLNEIDADTPAEVASAQDIFAGFGSTNTSNVTPYYDASGSTSPYTYASDAQPDPLPSQWGTDNGTPFIEVWGYIPPSPTTCGSDNEISIDETDIPLAGTDMLDEYGNSKIWISNNVSFDSATIKVQQTVTTQHDTAAVFDYTDGSAELSAGTWYLHVETSLGQINDTGLTITIAGGASTNSCAVAASSPGSTWTSSAAQRNSALAAFQSAGSIWAADMDIQNPATASFLSPAGTWISVAEIQNLISAEIISPASEWYAAAQQSNPVAIGGDSPASQWDVNVLLQNPAAASAESAGSAWSVPAELHNAASVAGQSPASVWSLSAELRNVISAAFESPASSWTSSVSQNNPASMSATSPGCTWLALAFTGNICIVSAVSPAGTWEVGATQENGADVSAISPASAWTASLGQNNPASVASLSAGSEWTAPLLQQNSVAVAMESPAGVWLANLLQRNGISVAAQSPGSSWEISPGLENSASVVWASPGSEWTIEATGPGVNICTMAATSPASLWDMTAEQRNAVSVSFISPAGGFSISVDLQNSVSVVAQSPASIWEVAAALRNACSVAAQSPASAWTAILTEAEVNFCAIAAQSPGSEWAAAAIQNNAASVSFVSPASAWEIAITTWDATEDDVIWNKIGRVILKQIPFGSNSVSLAFDIPAAWNVENLSAVTVKVADRTGVEVLPSDNCSLWPQTTLDGRVYQFDDAIVLADSATAVLPGEMLTIVGVAARENVVVKEYDSTTFTVTLEEQLKNDFESGAAVFSNMVSYDLDVSDTDTFIAGKTFVATWSPTPDGVGAPIRTILEITKFEADTSNIERRFSILYPRAYDAFLRPVNRMNAIIVESQSMIEFEMKSAGMDYHRIVGEEILQHLLMAKMACVWVMNADEDLEDERKAVNAEYTRLFSLLKGMPLWTDTDQDGVKDESPKEVTFHRHIFGRSW
jgi:hypothetical protein